MDEKTPSKLFRTLQILIPLASVAVGITGVLLTVASRKKELTCTLVSSTRLVSENLGGIHPDLHVEFHGQPIFSLSKMTFVLRNTGAAAILEKDIVESVKLSFPEGTKLLSSNVERTFPADLKFSTRSGPDPASVELQFPLLNRGDEALFSVYLLNSEPQKPNLEGRIVDVPQLVYSEANVAAVKQNFWPLQSHATRSVVRWTLASLYCGFTLLFLGLWMGCVGSYVSYLPWKRKWKSRYDQVVEELEEATKQERAKQQAEAPAPSDRDLARDEEILALREGMVSPDEIAHFTASAQHAVVSHGKLNRELKKRGIAGHPGSFIDSIGALAGFSALLLGLSAVCSTTALIVYRALSS